MDQSYFSHSELKIFVGEGDGVGIALWEGEGAGDGVGETDVDGVGVGVVVATGLGAAIFTPLSQTSFLPLLIHVYLIPAVTVVAPALVQAVPAFTAADAGSGENTSR